MTFEQIDKLVDAFVFLLRCWGYSSCGLVVLMSLAWVTHEIRGDEKR